MSRRGLTMVELLLALALLSALTLACVSWTAATARAAAIQGGHAAWRSAAERSLGLVDRALTTEDRSPEGRSRERWRVGIDGQSVTIRSRTAIIGADGDARVCSVLRLIVSGGVLLAEYGDDDGPAIASRPLLGEVGSLDVTAEPLEARTTRVTIRIIHAAGESCERSWVLPTEEVQ